MSAADAYRESVPTASGSKPTGTGREKTRLAPAISAQLGRDTTSSLLREVATSSAYGAPQRPLRRPLGPGPATADDKRIASPRLPALDAASGAVGDGVGRGRLALLIAVLVGILVGGIGARLATARSSTRQRSLPA